MNFKWLACLPFILTSGNISLAQQMTIHDSCVKVLEEDFADDRITLCPSSLPPIKTIQVERYSESKKGIGGAGLQYISSGRRYSAALFFKSAAN